MNSEANGPSTANSPRKEGRQETKGEGNLQQQACADTGSPPRKRDRIVYIENSANSFKAFIIQQVGTVDELIRGICNKYPDICIESLGMRVSPHRIGTLNRSYFTEIIPYEVDTVYVTLYLQKHSF